MAKIVRQLGTIERHLHKKDIVDLAAENANAIIDSGQYDLLKVYVELKRYETYLKGLIEHLKRPALNKAKEAGKQSFGYDDARVNISSRTKWDFSIDKEWSEIDQQIQQLKEQKKAREDCLRKLDEKRTILDEDTGEIREFELPKEIVDGLIVRL